MESPREPPFGGRMGEEPPNGGGGGGQGDCATVQGVGEWFGDSPGSPPLGGGWGMGAPVWAGMGAGRGREGYGDTSPRAPGAALRRRASTGGENMSRERSGGELGNGWLCA